MWNLEIVAYKGRKIRELWTLPQDSQKQALEQMTISISVHVWFYSLWDLNHYHTGPGCSKPD